MSGQPDERRKHARLKVDIKAHLQILFPEATFTPVVMEGKILDVSPVGLRIQVFNLSNSDYRKIIRGPRLSRTIAMFLPDQTLSRLFGKILNFDFHGMDASASCTLGISFGENEEKDFNNLLEFIRSHEQGTPQAMAGVSVTA